MLSSCYPSFFAIKKTFRIFLPNVSTQCSFCNLLVKVPISFVVLLSLFIRILSALHLLMHVARYDSVTHLHLLHSFPETQKKASRIFHSKCLLFLLFLERQEYTRFLIVFFRTVPKPKVSIHLPDEYKSKFHFYTTTRYSIRQLFFSIYCFSHFSYNSTSLVSQSCKHT